MGIELNASDGVAPGCGDGQGTLINGMPSIIVAIVMYITTEGDGGDVVEGLVAACEAGVVSAQDGSQQRFRLCPCAAYRQAEQREH